MRKETTYKAYKANGNILTMTHLTQMNWDYKDQLLGATNGTFESYYVYDASGNRVRKVVEKGNIVEERFYLGDYELFRKTTNETLEIERSTVHVSDDQKRIAMIDNDGITETIRYQIDNHLGSASLELDQNAATISYEEYHPFGTTSYRSGRSETEVSLKRYKYVGKERDEETGLYYYGARYYAAWIGRFCSVDPQKEQRSWVNPYNYVQNNPINRIDPTGALDDEPPNQPKSTIIEDVLGYVDIHEGYDVVHDNETGNVTVYKTEARWSKSKVSTSSNANIEVTRTIYDISAKGELAGMNVNKRNINAEYSTENNIIIPDEIFIKSTNIVELENVYYQKGDKSYEQYKTDPIVEGIKAIKGNNILQDRDVFFDQSYSLPNLYFIDFAQGIYVSALKTIGSIFGYETHGIDYLPLDYDKDKSTYLKIPQTDVENAAKRLRELSKKSEY